ncbi:hypothetical protein PILCRDRAFT_77340 [Piloderma croceum F 1598]|uniref:Nephrocystin 3-like N-terminal domain-containing protein n=1 Tax=Piloderma croceum (strain F 1598) TaxID=765440 RepID=A0A0C3FB25_PILCF|nr:hypothetical protein PILCRDRAFT_77340 [Piloderma croceum F 1598]
MSNTPDIRFLSLQIQFQKLIIEPLLSVRETITQTSNNQEPIVVVLDALDECGSPINRRNLLAVLADETAAIPSFLRIVITSRPESDIRALFNHRKHILHQELGTSSASNTADILRYFRHHVKEIHEANDYLQPNWPGEDMIQELVKQASGLFIWATTAWAFIRAGHFPQKRLDMLLKGQTSRSTEAALDALYRTALESAGNWDDEDFADHFRMIMGVVLAAKNPLSFTAIDQLLDLSPDEPSIHTISRLGCVLSHNPYVRVLHPSFADFLSSPSRCGRKIWHIDSVLFNHRLTMQCLDRLDKFLHRNICRMSLSADLEDEMLPEDVTYACVSFVDHVCSVIEVNGSSILERLDSFLGRHLLHWFEAMSIVGRSRQMITLLKQLSVWSNSTEHPVLELIMDAQLFAQTFSVPIEQHPLLVYSAALPFTPTSSTLYRKFHNTKDIPFVAGGFLEKWAPQILLMTGHMKGVNAAAFSADGTRIVSGSDDYTVQVWNASLGTPAIPPLLGHECCVRSVAFSADGTRIVSGSYDKTIRVWNALSGVEVCLPLQGHTDWVMSVAFSPEGTQIVSGSIDKTVRVWEVSSGAQVIPPLTGHSDFVWSVAFCPDKTHVISGSYDHTIRMWNIFSGVQVMLPLQHEGPVLSVAFSADGDRIVSGSADRTVRVWDVLSGTQVLLLKGHTDVVSAVAFSPDGTRIVSGSHDQTIRIWGALDGQTFPPLKGRDPHIFSVTFSPDGTRIVSGSGNIEVWDVLLATQPMPARPGHTYSVRSLVFSPDGTRIVSCSDDSIIRVWDVSSGAEALPPLQGHTDWVMSVAFSYDGTRIVSGSADKTILVWDALTGARVGLPLRGHTGWVLSAAFSPDGARIVSGSHDQTVRVWDALLGIEVLPPLTGHGHSARQVAFTPCGTRIVSGCDETKAIRVWDATSGANILSPTRGLLCRSWSDRFSHGNRLQHVYRSLKFDLPWQSTDSSNQVSHRAIYLTDNGWLLNLYGNGTVGLLPGTLARDSSCYATFGDTFAVGLKNGRLIIMHFPLSYITSSETRPVTGKKRIN